MKDVHQSVMMKKNHGMSTPTQFRLTRPVIDIISDPTTGNDEDDPYIEPGHSELFM